MIGGTCKKIMGLLVTIAGASFVLYETGSISSMTAHWIAGLTLLGYGLAKLTHAFYMCPMCKDCCGGCCEGKCEEEVAKPAKRSRR